VKEKYDEQVKKAVEEVARFLKFRPRTKKEVRDKLLLKGYPEEVISLSISFLEENNILNDEKFAREWFKERLSLKKIGLKKVKLELKRKGIDNEIIEKVASEFSNSENETANALEFLNLKFMKVGDKKSLSKEKLIPLLLRRGFSYDVASEATKEFLKDK